MSTARTAVRETNSVPTPPLTGTPAAPSATWTGASNELTRVSTAMSAGEAPEASAAPTTFAGGHDRVLVADDDDVARVIAGGPDHLGDTPAVVAYEAVGRGDDTGRAAIVDGERMVAAAREQFGEVDQPGRVGAGVPVDRLVVVADGEHIACRRREQPDEEQVRRGEVLELVDEHQS